MYANFVIVSEIFNHDTLYYNMNFTSRMTEI